MTWKEASIVALIFIVFPVILNYVLFTWRFPKTYGTGDNWLGFWGNYSGAFVGALVALWIANRQATEQREMLKEQLEEQRKDNLEQLEQTRKNEVNKEIKQRKLAQLPALVFLHNELENLITYWQEAGKERKNVIDRLENVHRESGHKLTEETKKKIKNEANEYSYKMIPVKEQVFSFVSLVEDVQLQIDLFNCFNYFKEFYEAATFDLNKLHDETNEKRIMLGDAHKMQLLFSQYESLKQEMLEQKRIVWFLYDFSANFEAYKDTFQKVEDEIESIKKIKQDDLTSL